MDARRDEARTGADVRAPARPGVERKVPQVEAPAQTPGPSARQGAPRGLRRLARRPWLVAVIVIAAVAAVAAAIAWWLHARHFESTDDAFIDARTIPISSQVAGMVSEVDVTDNQRVKSGTVLARIDDAIYRAQLAQAAAQVEQARANIANLDAQIDSQHARIDQANKQVAEAKAALAFSQQEYARYSDLVKTGAGTQQRAQQASSDLAQKQASYAGAEANATAAEKQLAVLESQRQAADAALKAAEAVRQLADINLGYTRITAPVDGRVTKLSGARGTYVQPGQAIMMFVPDRIWITANFKETQLDAMRPGQPVDITVDAYPGRTFHGRVDSIQSGSGTAFSLLPAENATGNYIKVVQRVPVKIVFDAPPDVQLGPGMSVMPTVRVR